MAPSASVFHSSPSARALAPPPLRWGRGSRTCSTTSSRSDSRRAASERGGGEKNLTENKTLSHSRRLDILRRTDGRSEFSQNFSINQVHSEPSLTCARSLDHSSHSARGQCSMAPARQQADTRVHTYATEGRVRFACTALPRFPPGREGGVRSARPGCASRARGRQASARARAAPATCAQRGQEHHGRRDAHAGSLSTSGSRDGAVTLARMRR